MSNTGRLRHRLFRVNSKDKSTGTTSRFALNLGATAIPRARTIGLTGFTCPNKVPNINTYTCDFVVSRADSFFSVSGTDDGLHVVEANGNSFTFLAGNQSITTGGALTTFLGTMGTSISSSMSTGSVTFAIVANHLVATVVGNSLRFVSNLSTGKLPYGLNSADAPVAGFGTSITFPDPFAGQLVKADKFQMSASELSTHLQTKINAVIAPDTVVVTQQNVLFPANPYDTRYTITFTGSPYVIWSKASGSPMSQLLGYTSETVSATAHIAPVVPQLQGLDKIYLHMRDTNGQQTMISNQGKQISVHAEIPIDVAYGVDIQYISQDRHYWRVPLSAGSNQLKSLHFVLRDVDGNQLVDLDDVDYTATFDLDVV